MCNFIQSHYKSCNHAADEKKLTQYCEIRQRIAFPPLHSWLSPDEMRFLETSCTRFTKIRKVPKDGKCLNCQKAERESEKRKEEEIKMSLMEEQTRDAEIAQARDTRGTLELWRRRWKSPEARATEARRLALEASMERRKEGNEDASG